MRHWMGRRDAVGLLAGVTAALGVPARAQQRPLIGFLSSRSPEDSEVHVAGFLRGLKAFGYVDGQSVAIEYRWARGDFGRLPALAQELVAQRPAIVAALGGTQAARAMKEATSTIPVLFVASVSVMAGLVTSLSRPGANLTGIDFVSGELGGKRLELVSQLEPGATSVGFLVNPRNETAASSTQDVRTAAETLGKRLVVVHASSESELSQAFSALTAAGVKALVVQNDPPFDGWRNQLIALAARHGIAAIYHIREFPAGGGLMSYGASLVDSYRQLGVMAGRVLKGAKVADLPIEWPTRFELVINLKAADALGLTVPSTLIARADELIE